MMSQSSGEVGLGAIKGLKEITKAAQYQNKGALKSYQRDTATFFPVWI